MFVVKSCEMCKQQVTTSSQNFSTLLFLSQCGNLANFLPFWFYYVNLILADLRRVKTAILTILQALGFSFLGTSHLKMSKFPKIQNSKLVKWSKWPIYYLYSFLSEISQNWFHVKIKWQENCSIYALWKKKIWFHYKPGQSNWDFWL